MAAGTMVAWEVHSFVTKFLNLSSMGHDAYLSLQYNNGKLEVNLNSSVDDTQNSIATEATSP